MIQNVLVNFQSDGSEKVIKEVDKLTDSEKQAETQAKKYNDEIKDRQQLLQNAGGVIGKYIAQLQATQKAAIGAFGVKQLKDFETQAIKSFKAMAAGAEKGSIKMNDFNAAINAMVTGGLAEAGVDILEFNTALKAAGTSMDDFVNTIQQGVMDEFSQNFEQAEAPVRTLRTRLKELKDQLALMESAGQEGTQAFEQMAIEAGQLEDQIGDTAERIRALSSDTANMDAAVEGIQLLATGFQIAAGSAALFGTSEEDMQKVLVKLNAIMAITQGLTEVQKFLRGQSILAIKAEAAMTGINTAAQRVYAIAVGTSTGAMRAFRIALLATGIGAIIALLVFAAEKMDLFGESADEAAEKLKKQKEEAEKLTAALDDVAAAQEKVRNSQAGGLDNLNRELNLLKAKGATAKQVYDQEQKIRQAELFNLQVLLQTHQGNKIKEAEIVKQFGDKQNEILAAQYAYEKSLKDQALKDSEDKAAKQKIINDKAAADKKKLDDEFAQKEADLALFRQQENFDITNRQHDQQVKQNDIEFGTKEKFAGDVAKMQVNTNQVINDTVKQQNIAQDEAELKRVEEAEKKKAELKKQAIQAVFQIAQQSADALFEAANARRQQELEIQLTALGTAREQELNNKNLTEQQKDDINKKYQGKERQLKLKAFEEDKKMKRNQAIINGLLGITQAFATAPWPLSIIFAAVVAATTALSVAKIASTQPGFKKGGYTGNKRENEVAGFVHGQEFVAHAEATRKYKPALEAINQLKFDEYLAKIAPIPRTMTPLPEWAAPAASGSGIDYDRLGRSVAEHQKAPSMIMNFDEDGASAYLIEKNRQVFIRNKRYKL